MPPPRSQQNVFYGEPAQRHHRPPSNASYLPYFMNHQSPHNHSTSSSDTFHSRQRYDWAQGPSGSSRRTVSSSDRTSSSDSRDDSVRNSYANADLTFLSDELLSPGIPDEMHAFEKKAPRIGASRYISEPDTACTIWSPRGWANLLSMIVLSSGLVMLFAGWPIMSYFRTHTLEDLVSGTGGSSGIKRAPSIPGFRTLIDPDTPREAMSRVGADGHEYELVFSDEFEVDGRTFWPGDDPYWQAADQHYWPTGDQEWYDPDGATTQGGSLVITLSEINPDINHNLDFRSAMLTTWNKLCFTGGYFETSLILPGTPSVGGFWPAVWTMGNLARPGYGATTDGTWPFSYNSCDVGAMPNQTHPKTGEPGASVLQAVGDLSWQPGQKLSRCTCAGEDHPGPRNDDGTYKGRASPELDMLEAYAYEKTSTAYGSQSLQIAPYDDKRIFPAVQDQTYSIYSESGYRTSLNSYHGGNRQQTLSALATLPASNFELVGNRTLPYGMEWVPDTGEGQITWSVNKKPTFTLNQTALAGNSRSMVGERLVSNEPMYLILNLGISDTFVPVNRAALKFPAQMRIDYVRFYQRKGSKNVNCSPKNYPTEKYINDHLPAYQNANLTTWSQAGYTFPKTNFMDGCRQPS